MQRLITSNGLTLWTESFGQSGDPSVLLVMGAMNQGIFWPDEFCQALAAAGFYVVRYDHRDTGQSSRVDFQTNPYDLNSLTEDAAAVIRNHKLDRPTVIGLSMGGYIAQLLASVYPGFLSRIALISSTADHRPYMAGTTGNCTAVFSLPGPDRSYLDYLIKASTNLPQSLEGLMQSMSEGWKGACQKFCVQGITFTKGVFMPRNSKTAAASGKAALPQLSKQMLEELIPGPVTKEQFEDIFQNFKKAFIERALSAEMSHHLAMTRDRPNPRVPPTTAMAVAPRP
jgi:pimeloyl-ACP methyl ester carboxylesterase